MFTYPNTSTVPKEGDLISLGCTGTMTVETVIVSKKDLAEWDVEEQGILVASQSTGRVFVSITDEDLIYISRAN